MTADSPASGLPQEAVDAGNHFEALHYLWCDLRLNALAVCDCGAPETFAAERAKVAEERQRADDLADEKNALNERIITERAKVAGLQQAVDKVRELCTIDDDHPLSVDVFADSVLALLPDVQADDRGAVRLTPVIDDGLAPCDACAGTGRNPRSRRPATVEQPTGTDGECGHVDHRDCGDHGIREVREGLVADRSELPVDEWWEPCPSQSDKGEQ